MQFLDHLLHLLRRVLGAVGEVAHFVGNHRKSTSGLTGTSGFDRGIERQQVGLLGDAGDYFQNLPDVDGVAVERLDVAARVADLGRQLVHGRNGFIHNLLTLFGQRARIARMLRGEGGVLGDFLGGGTELVDRRSHTTGARGLLVGVEHRRVGGGDNAQGHFVDLARGRRHFADRGVDAFDETVERQPQCAEFVMAMDGQAFGQVAFAFGDVVHGAAHGQQRLHQEADQHAQQRDDDHHCNHHGNDRRGAEFAQHRERGVLVQHQCHVPVCRRHPVDMGEGDELAFAVDLDFFHARADFRRTVGVSIAQVLEHPFAVRVNQDLAVGAHDEGMAVAAEVQRVDDRTDARQVDVGAGNANHLALALNRGCHRDHQLAGRGGDVRFGDDGLLRAVRSLVPAAGARVVIRRAIARRDREHHAIGATEVTQLEIAGVGGQVDDPLQAGRGIAVGADLLGH
ncbi:hypothetical protein D3C76_634510 [compost metagenome]